LDTIRTIAEERHFFTVELRLREFGQVLLVGDQAAVERVARVVSEHDEHELVDLSADLTEVARLSAGADEDRGSSDSGSA
jgi:hypothetical protein